MNLINLIKNYATPEMISMAAKYLGESEHATTKGIESSIPSILGGILNASTNTGQMSDIWKLINDNNNNSNLLSDLSGLFEGNSNYSSQDSIGGNLLNIIFGNNNSGLLGAIGKFAGFNNSGSALKVLSLAAPLILSYLKKKVKTEGYGASGLTSWLGSQKNDIMSAIPSEISSAMNFVSNLKTANYSNSNVDTKSGGNNWMPWLIGLIALLGLMWFVMKSCNDGNLKVELAKKEAALAEATKIEAARLDSINNAAAAAIANMYVGVDSAVKAKWLALGDMINLTLADGSTLSIPQNGIEGKLVSWILDSSKLVDKTTWFDFDRILFETGSDKLNAASKEQVGNIVSILKAFPKVKAKIGGYTDNIGNPVANKKLSAARATTVMNEILAMGIEAKRLAAEGYGQEFPVGDNSTPEGRELNRRVSLRVTQK